MAMQKTRTLNSVLTWIMMKYGKKRLEAMGMCGYGEESTTVLRGKKNHYYYHHNHCIEKESETHRVHLLRHKGFIVNMLKTKVMGRRPRR